MILLRVKIMYMSDYQLQKKRKKKKEKTIQWKKEKQNSNLKILERKKRIFSFLMEIKIYFALFNK